jgi:CheY-like chemotaxis protein
VNQKPVNPPPVLRSRTVLVIEDDLDNRDAMRVLLEAHGAAVVVASNAEDGLTHLTRTTPDAILCDLSMPGMGGVEFGRRLRSQPQYQGILLIAFTARRKMDDFTETWRVGFDAHMTKPITAEALIGLVRKIVQHTAHRKRGGE